MNSDCRPQIPSREQMRAALVEKQGEAVVAALEKCTVAICGVGGLGSNVAVSLARAGVKKLVLIDFDRVEMTNLQRQQYKAAQVGMYKAEAMASNLREVAPYLDVEVHVERVTAENAVSLVGEADAIVEAFDKAEAKATLVNVVLEELPEKFLVAASGMAGFGDLNDITTRRITKRFYLCGDGKTDVDEVHWLAAPRVAACAAHEAQTVIRLLCGL